MSAPSAVPQAVTRPAVVTLIALAVIYTLSVVDRMMMGALVPLIKAEFSLSDTQIGLLTGVAFTFFFGICGLPLALYADRGPRKLIIVASVAVWSLMTAACGMAQSFFQLLLARLGVGLGEAGAGPASFSILSDHFPPNRRPLAMGVLTGGAMLGIMLGLSVAGWLGETYGWRTAFLVLGLPGLLIAVLGWMTITEPARGATDAQAFQPMKSREALASLGRNRAYVWLMVGNGVQGFSTYGMSQWLPSFYVRTHGMTVGQVATAFGITFGLGMIVGAFGGGALGTRLARRDHRTLHLAAWASLASAPLFVLCLWAPSVPLSIAAVFCCAVLIGAVSPTAAAAGQTMVVPAARATGQAISNFLNALGGYAVGVLLVGIASDLFAPQAGSESLRLALTLGQIMPVVSGFAYLVSMKHWRRT